VSLWSVVFQGSLQKRAEGPAVLPGQGNALVERA
jgi:hypothetical protein